MSSCVMWEGVWRLFNGTSNMKSVLAAKLLEGSPCNHLQLGSHPIGPQIPSCDDQFELQADQGLKANLKNKGNPYQHDTEDVKTCSFTPPKTSRGKAFVPPLVLTPVIETTAPSSSKQLSSVQPLEKIMTPRQRPPSPSPQSAYVMPGEGPSNNPYLQRVPPIRCSPSALASCASIRGITPESLVSSDPQKHVSGKTAPHYFIGSPRPWPNFGSRASATS